VSVSTIATLRNMAGARRRTRRAQNDRNLMVWSWSPSRNSSVVIRNPDRVKNVETPRNPPGREWIAVW
jgi:hypothetical protein